MGLNLPRSGLVQQLAQAAAFEGCVVLNGNLQGSIASS
jgi:hypothetical protein